MGSHASMSRQQMTQLNEDERMNNAPVRAFTRLIAAIVFLAVPHSWAQEASAASAENATSDSSPAIVVGHSFTAVKYARRVRVAQDGKLQFLHNERYPTRIARDGEGRLMMQVIHSDDLSPDCDRLDLRVPPVCPVWGIFVIDPVAHTVTHWLDGERAGKGAAEFPLTAARLEEVAADTSSLPALQPDFTEEDGEVTRTDLGERTMEGIGVSGVRWTLRYEANQDGQTVHRQRIHEVWTSQEMQLIVRVIDGDPKGEETVWGLENLSIRPDPSLFRPPDALSSPGGYGIYRNKTDRGCSLDFEDLKSWFEN
jgi:hypothetical protein